MSFVQMVTTIQCLRTTNECVIDRISKCSSRNYLLLMKHVVSLKLKNFATLCLCLKSIDIKAKLK